MTDTDTGKAVGGPSPAEEEKLRAETRKLEAEADALANKSEAQTEKLRAETQQAGAEATKLLAEAEEALQKARQETLKTAVAQIGHDREREKRDRELASFNRKHVYRFTTGVDEETVAKCVQELNFWHTEAPECDMEILFDSPGGSVFAGLSLFDYIQELKRDGHRVVTSARGMAASMAGILLQAGHKRVMGAESYMLIHEVSTGAIGKIGEIEDEVELVKKVQERVLDIFASRSKLTKATLRRRWRRKDWWISSEEALRWGLVDEIR